MIRLTNTGVNGKIIGQYKYTYDKGNKLIRIEEKIENEINIEIKAPTQIANKGDRISLSLEVTINGEEIPDQKLERTIWSSEENNGYICL